MTVAVTKALEPGSRFLGARRAGVRALALVLPACLAQADLACTCGSSTSDSRAGGSASVIGGDGTAGGETAGGEGIAVGGPNWWGPWRDPRQCPRLHPVLLDAGEEPRATIRVRPTFGTKGRRKITRRGGTDILDRPTPGDMREALVEFVVGEAALGEETPVRFRVLSYAGVDPYDPIAFSGTAFYEGCGVGLIWKVVTRSHADLDFELELRRIMHEAAPVFPAVPIGVGARWTVRSTVQKPRWKSDDVVDHVNQAWQEATFTLVALDFDGSIEREPTRASVEVNLRHHSALNDPYPKLSRMELSGSGSARFDVDLRGVPFPYGHLELEHAGHFVGKRREFKDHRVIDVTAEPADEPAAPGTGTP